VLAYESGVTHTADPAGGSYCIEGLTDEIEAAARRYIERIDAMGGMVRAIRQGYVQREIQNAAYEFQKKVETKEQILVGVNAFRAEKEELVPILRIDPEIEERQKGGLEELRRTRNGEQVKRALQRLAETARSTNNLMPAVLDAVESYATLGEISDTLREAFGVYEDRVVF
jgi:methylmalonyl-CoA mutase N-terminal domain/subunit